MQIKLYIWRINIPKIHIKEEKMKKVLLIVTLPLCLAMGQDAPELPGWGVYGGVVMSSASGDGLDDVEYVALPGFGVSKGVMLGGIPLSAGIGLHGRGYHMEMGADAHVEVKANYLDVWAQVPYPLGPVFLGLGASVGTFISGSTHSDFLGVETETDLTSDDLGLDYALNFGVSYPVGDTGATVGAMYYLGLAEPAEGLKFNGIFFNAGYNF